MVEEIITTFSRVRWLLVIDAMMTLVDRELIISGLRLAAAEAE